MVALLLNGSESRVKQLAYCIQQYQRLCETESHKTKKELVTGCASPPSSVELSTKYYTASLDIVTLRLGVDLEESFSDSIEGYILVLDEGEVMK
jgi:hypothetical protein